MSQHPRQHDAFTLDAQLLRQRKAASARRVHAIEIPLIRAFGFAILCVMVLLHDLHVGAAVPNDALVRVWAVNIAYAFGSWLLLWLYFGRTGRLDLGLLFLHLDLAVWMVTLHHMEGTQLFIAYLLLVRVVDQVGFGSRRALYFDHVVVAAYLLYSAVIAIADPPNARWPERLGLAVTIYLIGIYFAFTGTVTERLRERTRVAVRTARQLVDDLGQKTRQLQAQAEELETARRAAEIANVAKSQFLATMSHEIRTPMTGLLGTAELLLSGPLDGAQRRYAETAQRSATALLAMIDDVLDLARIEAGKAEIRSSAFDLRALVDDVVALMAASAGSKALELSVEIAADVPDRVLGDPVRLRQVLTNLLSNAVKFTDAGRVQVLVAQEARDGERILLRFEVRDTGVGIPEEELARIFDPFRQVDASTTRRHGGSGLGLAIVKELTQLMGGEVSVASTVGLGTAFVVRLALGRSSEPAPPPPPPAPAPLPRPMHVLLAEDNLVNQIVLQEMLKQLGCTVDVASDGYAADEAVRSHRYDIVFMDCHMPGLDGYEATRRIRAREQGTGVHTPILALTAAALEEDRHKCAAAGMDDFLSKPVTVAELGAAVERWAGIRLAHAG